MSPFVSRSFAVSERCCAIIILIILISKYEECEKKKPSSISTKETILHLYTRNSHFCIAFVKKMINVICVLVFCSSMFYYFRFICGHQFYCRQNIDYVQTRDNQGIATYIFTVSVPFVFAFLFIINFPSFKARTPCVISCFSIFESCCRITGKLRKKSHAIIKIQNEFK